MRQLWATVLHTSGAKIYSMAIGMLVLFATARLLGPEGRGHLAAVMAWVGLFSTFAYLSLDQVALHRLSQDLQRQRFAPLFGSLLLLAVVLTLLAWLCAATLYAVQPDGAFKGLSQWVLLAAFIGLPFMVWEHYASGLLAGLERVRLYNRALVVGRTVTMVAVLAFVGVLDWGVPGAVLGSTLGQVVVALGGIGFLVAHARQGGRRIGPDRQEVRALLSGAGKLHLNAIGTYLFASANILILNYYRSPEEVGQFQLAQQLLAMLMVLPQAASTVLFGRVASLGPAQAWQENKRMLVQVSAMMLAVAAAAALLAGWAIPLLAGPAFAPAVEPFRWMLVGLAGTTFSALMAPQWIGRGYFWQAATVTFAIGCVNLAGNLWLIPSHGMDGAVAVFVATYLVTLAVNLAMAWHCEARDKRVALAAPAS